MAKRPTRELGATAEDPDNLPITPEDLERGLVKLVRKRGRPVGSNKVQKTIRLDTDIVEALMADGPGWQTRLNGLLRKALKLDTIAKR